jgi:hypothetical protein
VPSLAQPTTGTNPSVRRLSRRGFVAAAAGLALAGSARGVDAAGRNGVLADLDADDSHWQVWVDPGDVPEGSVRYDQPAVQDNALRLAITGGDRPYTHIHCYRTLRYNRRIAAVSMTMRWRFSDTTWNNEGAPSTIQMIEPAFNIWDGERRFEWALQWQNVGDGSNQGEIAPAWRLWNGSSWEATGYGQRLAPNVWHDLELCGEIRDGAIRYVRMVSDDLAIPLDRTFAATEAVEGKRMAVTMQLGGNYNQDPYECYVRNLNLAWQDRPYSH